MKKLSGEFRNGDLIANYITDRDNDIVVSVKAPKAYKGKAATVVLMSSIDGSTSLTCVVTLSSDSKTGVYGVSKMMRRENNEVKPVVKADEFEAILGPSPNCSVK